MKSNIEETKMGKTKGRKSKERIGKRKRKIKYKKERKKRKKIKKIMKLKKLAEE